ncbi:DUF397 domain-containing protein [Streptomyces sp. NBC_01803]|uniref:DUF397 domain-containing protein n=1 Tax=Streptomyces sp. NBC_01803 TaxID=2975946 RepID=UPI002DDA9B0A|nr:DUF397 domain-containing protein [Streptomyces sp. NBC_01803]WSA45230.1 DUF397 domain-containing protein [Streptomyces sp. NBC_01803]
MKSTFDLSGAEWTKSTHSSGNGGQCVECARNLAAATGAVPVRDSKDPRGPVLAFTTNGWTSFLSAVASGDLHAH